MRIVDGRAQPTRYASSGAYEHYLRAELALNHGDANQAIDELRAALSFDPQSPYLHRRLAEVLRQADHEESR